MSTVLVMFKNAGNDVFNVTSVMGSLNYQYDFSQYVQNFSALSYGVTIGPEQEVTFAYHFMVSPQAPSEKFYVSHHIFYRVLLI